MRFASATGHRGSMITLSPAVVRTVPPSRDQWERCLRLS
jgi:hypothetical protein